ncbi:MAG: hypothetical protein KDD62_15945, partial [Bdellovibrionales bacterium]|nr:hypothetical protein [Bdellovibrionales bacterium]
MTTPHAQTVSTDKLVTILREAWYAGRPIVPLVGAGMSVDSGMPALSSIIRYVAKLQVYLDKRMYLPDPHSRVLLNKIDEKLNSQPWEFITAFGWPDRFQLNFDVRQALNQTDLNTAIGEALTALAAQIHPGSTWHLNDYIGRVAEKFEKLNETYAFEGGFLPKAPSTTKYVDSFAFQVSADWKPLLREVTGHNQALIDALFGRLARHRHPGLGHKFLAHLCQLLRVRTLLTFNFDSLIEAAFISEKLSHRVFSMEHGTQLPSVSLLDDSLSVIKMHGSTHNIVV